MQAGINIEQAYLLLNKHIKQQYTLNHSVESEAVMRALARRLGKDEELWGIAGLLHDIDWEEVSADVNEHGIKCQQILTEAGASKELIDLIVSHVWGFTTHYPDNNRSTIEQHALASAETVTGLIFAAALVNPEKKVANVKVSSLIKKMKDKSFAAKVDRSVICECEKIGLNLDEFLEISLKAMQEIAEKIGL